MPDQATEVGGWQRDHATALRVVAASHGNSEENRATFGTVSPVSFLLQAGSEVADAYAADWTPAAVLISRAGRLASAVAYGEAAIRSLMSRAAASPDTPFVDPSEDGRGRRSLSLVRRGPARLGDPAPRLARADLDGRAVDLADCRGRDTLLVFKPGGGDGGRCDMILGMSIATFTLVHVILSLIGIAAGLVVLGGMLGSKRLEGWTAVFLVTTILTSVTGFLFPITRIGPPHMFGVISLVVLAVALLALYGQRLRGAWRWLYVVGVLVALYLNVFVGVVQAFLKLPLLNALAPTQSESPFLIAQLLVLAAFVVLGARAVSRFRPTGPAQA